MQRCLKWVKYLPELGIEPTVITVDADQATYPVRDESLLREVPPGVRVIRTATLEPFGSYQKLTGRAVPHGGFANEGTPSLTQKMMRFVRGNLFIPDPRRGWNSYALAAVEKLLAQGEKFDAVLTSSPPHSTQLIGLELQKKHGLRWLADLRDPWTDIYYTKDLHRTAAAAWLDAHYEQQVLRGADAVLVTSPETERLFRRKLPDLAKGKIVVLPNGYDEADFQGLSAPPADCLLLTHTGTITARYRIDNLLKAIAECQQRYPRVPWRLRFVGQADAGVREQVAAAKLAEVTEFIPFVPHEQSIAYLLSSSVLLMAIPDVALNRGILPGKIFEYLATAKPVLCVGPAGSDADQVLREAGAGQALPYDDYGLMLSTLEQLARGWQQNPNLDLPHARPTQYSRRGQAARLAELVRALAGGGAAARP
ncbi:glycosyltransferase family 4 protein [Hymenobacter sp. BRD67]|nr:glycosyltransferase family 4 protein [Hymenobacter sp. BRD67]